MVTMSSCIVCSKTFERRGTHGPVPKYCSKACRAKKQRENPERREYERLYQAAARRAGKRDAYNWRYWRRPEVKARARERAKIRWWTDENYRQRQLERMRSNVRNRPAIISIPSPYTGHRWLEMARQVVAPQGVDPEAPWAEDRYDEMGEVLLALLEGRDMKEALREYRRKEYIPRFMTKHWDDFRDEDDDSFADWFMPKQPSAEEEVVAVESIREKIPSRFYRKGAMSRHMKHRTQQPSRRRMKDAGWRKYAA